MSSNFGKNIEISIFGESHGEAIGVVINGLPAGEKIDFEEIKLQMSRRAPGRDKTATPRKERDEFKILSGMIDDVTTGAPLTAVIENSNTKSGDYGNLKNCPRPSHSDYAAYVKYNGCNDIRGGGHFSGRLTAPLTIAGAFCRQILERRGIVLGGHVLSVHGIVDEPFDPVGVSAEQLKKLSREYFSTNSAEKQAEMRKVIEDARLNLDSVGGAVEIAVTGIPAGVGSPIFGGVENIVAAAVYGVPAVKSVAFGAGDKFSSMRGSEANDQLCVENGRVTTLTNNCGGICGGITNGMPLIITAALKPTPSISRPQQSVDLGSMSETTLEINGRHDPCIVPRALPAIEAAVAVAIANLCAEAGIL